MPRADKGKTHRSKFGATPAERLAAFVDRTPNADGCWTWRGPVGLHGYGALRWQGRSRVAHVIVWTEERGPVPDNLFLLHTCDNRLCVNPDHLFLGTHEENMADMKAKGRASRHGCVTGGIPKLTEDDVREIRRRRELGESQGSLARQFGVSKSYVQGIVAFRNWRHLV